MSHVTRVPAEQFPPSSPDRVSVYSAAETVTRPYEILGKVFEQRKGGIFISKSEATIKEHLRASAASMGADAIVGFRYCRSDAGGIKSGPTRWGSGIAVKFLDSTTARHHGRPQFTVAIECEQMPSFGRWTAARSRVDAQSESDTAKRHTNNESATRPATREEYLKDSIKMEHDNRCAVLAAQYQLEVCGYYSTFAESGGSLFDSDQFEKCSEFTLDSLYGEETEHILLITPMNSTSSNIGIAASASSTIHVKLYSRTTRQFVWEGAAISSTFVFGFGGVLEETSNSRREHTIFRAMRVAFQTLAHIGEKRVQQVPSSGTHEAADNR